MDYKVLITSTGLGSRLGELTKDTNKSLIEIGGKTIISHIVDLYPKDIEIVVTLGYFGGIVEIGDIYYDLAKLNHNLTVNHDIVYQDMYTIENNNGSVICDIHRKQILVESQEELYKFVRENGFDEKKVRVLTAIVWLNMSPLHHYPFSKFLYYFGKYNLHKSLQ